MPSGALLQRASRPGVNVCRKCTPRERVSQTFARQITQNYLRKTLEAELEWKEKGKEITAGKRQSFMKFLEERGYVHQTTSDREALEELMNEKRIGAYCGVDPTAPSMHVGHMLPFMVIFWMYLHGFAACTLLGGATAKIGDPEGRTKEREKQASDQRKANMALMHIQLKKLWESVEMIGRKYGYHREWSWRRVLANNNTWLNKVSILEIMAKLGTNFRIGPLLGRETVKIRQKQGEGMSFAEFSYPMLQAWDFWELYQRNKIQLQIGGADQFGNILTGVQAVNLLRTHERDPALQEKIHALDPRYEYQFTAHGMTVPLLQTASGEKIGKSAGNAIWLDPSMTSSFDLYGYFVKTADSDVERYLKLFTFVPTSTILKVVEEHKKEPFKRLAQHLLAAEFVELAHGPKAAQEAAHIHRNVVSKKSVLLSSLKDASQASNPQASNPQASNPQASNPYHPSKFLSNQLNKMAPPVTYENPDSVRIFLPRSLVYDQNLGAVLYHSGLVASKSEGHKLISKSSGAYVGGIPGQLSGGLGDELKFTPIKMASETADKFIFDEDKLLLRVGKWRIKMIHVIPDVEFRAKGLTAPGWEKVQETEKEEQKEYA